MAIRSSPTHHSPILLYAITMTLGSKGKGRDLEMGWWQYLPLGERSQRCVNAFIGVLLRLIIAYRPVAWSGLSTIFTAHPTKPCVVGRQFPSLKSFELPLPKAIAQAVNSYNPPTIITISSDNMWLFAFFPGIDVDGVGCIWARTFEADSWIPREYQAASGYPWNAGVVAAAWVSNDRQVHRVVS